MQGECLLISIKQSTVIPHLVITAINHVYAESELVKEFCRFFFKNWGFFLYFESRDDEVHTIFILVGETASGGRR